MAHRGTRAWPHPCASSRPRRARAGADLCGRGARAAAGADLARNADPPRSADAAPSAEAAHSAGAASADAAHSAGARSAGSSVCAGRRNALGHRRALAGALSHASADVRACLSAATASGASAVG